MKYQKVIEHNITGLTDRELSAIQAGLIMIANGQKGGSYPEYKSVAADLLSTILPPENRPLGQ